VMSSDLKAWSRSWIIPWSERKRLFAGKPIPRTDF
jgi:hypothetical protein